SHGHLLYTNWLNYYVYQTTPYVVNDDMHSDINVDPFDDWDK
ncbi:homoserine O-succinyltransferase, partial [Butyricicoccus pullicaecorum]|nr:homoserine O-succinyltransferase [Butyricicoccus pullicaecorum]MCF2671706.1 homoserine O-succinyltransferase [Butyricicoccus pullicaecorum]